MQGEQEYHGAKSENASNTSDSLLLLNINDFSFTILHEKVSDNFNDDTSHANNNDNNNITDAAAATTTAEAYAVGQNVDDRNYYDDDNEESNATKTKKEETEDTHNGGGKQLFVNPCNNNHALERTHHHEEVLRIAIVGCGGWFANRAHLPALAKLVRPQRRRQGDAVKPSISSKPSNKSCTTHNNSNNNNKYQITVLCGSHPERALRTLARHGVHLTIRNNSKSSNDDGDAQTRKVDEDQPYPTVYTFPTLEAYLDYEQELLQQEHHKDDHNIHKENVGNISHNNKLDMKMTKSSSSLADVCLLCLPTPRMTQAIGRCLRANKYVISEKPASNSVLASHPLWDAYYHSRERYHQHHHYDYNDCDKFHDDETKEHSSCRYYQQRRRTPIWLVAENWAYKPSLKAFRQHLDTYRVLHGAPIAYHMCLRQYHSHNYIHNHTNRKQRTTDDTNHGVSSASSSSSSSSSSWRQLATPSEQLRDVGVHVIRALRHLFGEVTKVRNCHHDSKENKEEQVVSLEGTLLHEDENVALRGKLQLELISLSSRETTTNKAAATATDKDNDSIAQLVVTFAHNGIRLVWDMATSSFYRLEQVEDVTADKPGASCLTPIPERIIQQKGELLERVSGDHWITGGVAPMLESAMELFYQMEFGSMNTAKSSQPCEEHDILSSISCRPEEGLRDVAVIDAMLVQAEQSIMDGMNRQRRGFRYPPKPCDDEFGSISVHYFRPQCILPSRRYAVNQSASFAIFNSTGTVQYRPNHVAWCSSLQDVVDTVKQANNLHLRVQPIGTLHSYSLIHDDDSCWISVALWNRIIDFRIEKSSTNRTPTALVRVGVGMTLHALCLSLKSVGYTLPSLPVLLHQSIGGAISTGSHGSSAHHGTVSDSVVAVRIVKTDGDVVTIIPQDHICSVELKNIVGCDNNGVIESDSLLREARCGLGSCGVLLDVIFRVVPTLQVAKSEVALDMNDDDIAKTIIDLALSTDHCWVQWRLDSDSAGVAAATTLCHDTNRSQDGTYLRYHGRSWYPPGPLVANVLDGSRKALSGESKYTLQCSFPSALLGDVVKIVKQMGVQLATRVVEFKFLKGSSLTIHAPNSAAENDTDFFVALNVWWDLDSPEMLAELEHELDRIPGMILHQGKWCPNSISRQVNAAYFPREPYEPMLSVILPAYNAMPWLPTALLDVLKQEVDGQSVEVLVADDASTDDSLSFLLDVAIGLAERGSIEVVASNKSDSYCLSPSEAKSLVAQRKISGKTKSCNPALMMASRNADLSDTEATMGTDSFPQVSVAAVIAGTGKRNRLRVLVGAEFINCGQGAAMTRCLRLAKAPFIGHMESDDARPEGAFQTMLDALRCHPEWDGVASNTKCVGWKSCGMSRYVDWQSEKDTPEKMKNYRFVEIPALLQASIFRRWAVDRTLAIDNLSDDCSYRDDAMWPVDYHFWLSFFQAGLHVGRVPKDLFYWRQHKGQQTRNHGRLSISNLRKCKCYFLCKEGGPIWKAMQKCPEQDVLRVEVWSTGKTLVGWVDDLEAELMRTQQKCKSTIRVRGVTWKPGTPKPIGDNSEIGAGVVLRLFAFGMEKAQKKVRADFGDEWDDDRFMFVARCDNNYGRHGMYSIRLPFGLLPTNDKNRSASTGGNCLP